MTNTCNPNTGPTALAITDPCSMLPYLRGALMQLATGSGRAEIRHGDQTLRYHPANVKELRAEIQRLEQFCNNDGTTKAAGGRAVQVQHRPRVGFGSDAYFTNRYR